MTTQRSALIRSAQSARTGMQIVLNGKMCSPQWKQEDGGCQKRSLFCQVVVRQRALRFVVLVAITGFQVFGESQKENKRNPVLSTWESQLSTTLLDCDQLETYFAFPLLGTVAILCSSWSVTQGWGDRLQRLRRRAHLWRISVRLEIDEGSWNPTQIYERAR